MLFFHRKLWSCAAKPQRRQRPSAQPPLRPRNCGLKKQALARQFLVSVLCPYRSFPRDQRLCHNFIYFLADFLAAKPRALREPRGLEAGNNVLLEIPVQWRALEVRGFCLKIRIKIDFIGLIFEIRHQNSVFSDFQSAHKA